MSLEGVIGLDTLLVQCVQTFKRKDDMRVNTARRHNRFLFSLLITGTLSLAACGGGVSEVVPLVSESESPDFSAATPIQNSVAQPESEGELAPAVAIEALADFVFRSNGSAESDSSWQVFSFAVAAGDLVEANVAWGNSSADVRVFLRDGTNTQVDLDIENTNGLAEMSALATRSGEWSVAVNILNGVVEYDILVNTLEGSGAVEEVAVREVEIDRVRPTLPITISPADSWQVNGDSNVVLTVGDVLYVGGDFSQVYNESGGQLPRGNLVALDRYTGAPTNFAPELDGEVFALAVSPDNQTLYVGGAFLEANGISRKRVASYDLRTGELTGFDAPAPGSALRAIAVSEDKVYIGGLFTRVGDTDRDYLAALDPITGELDANFAPSLDARITSLIVGIDRLWVGGDFTQIDGTRQRYFGAIDPNDASYQATDEVSHSVIALAASGTQVFVAIGGPGGRASAFNRATGTEQWEIVSDGNFQAVDVGGGDYVYFGGHYEIVEGDERADRLTRHDKQTGRLDTAWLPQVNGIRSINAIDVEPDGLYFGGDFTKVDGKDRKGVAIFLGSTSQ